MIVLMNEHFVNMHDMIFIGNHFINIMYSVYKLHVIIMYKLSCNHKLLVIVASSVIVHLFIFIENMIKTSSLMNIVGKILLNGS
jgi:hypothetical protein